MKTSIIRSLLLASAATIALGAQAQPEHRTTDYGAARADVVLSMANLLECGGDSGGPFALCFYSGPATGSGKGGENLPCVLGPDMRRANCTCYVESGTYYVDINGILNPEWYEETIKICGVKGTGCKNLAAVENCKFDSAGEQLSKAAVAACRKVVDTTNALLPTAPVCEQINHRTAGNVMYSTFGFQDALRSHLGSTSCPVGFYVGCMTAPCEVSSSSQTAQCACPSFFGPYEVGQTGVTCYMGSNPDSKTVYKSFRPGDHVWSASYNPFTYTSPDQ